MADFTTTYGIDNTKEVDVTCHFDGALRIVVQENCDSNNPPTANLLQRGIVGGSGQIRVAKGTPAIFSSGPYRSGEKVGTIETDAGSITVAQIETKAL
jgi:hypothetical protein